MVWQVFLLLKLIRWINRMGLLFASAAIWWLLAVEYSLPPLCSYTVTYVFLWSKLSFFVLPSYCTIHGFSLRESLCLMQLFFYLYVTTAGLLSQLFIVLFCCHKIKVAQAFLSPYNRLSPLGNAICWVNNLTTQVWKKSWLSTLSNMRFVTDLNVSLHGSW